MAALRDKPLLVELCIENGADVNAWISFSAASQQTVDPQWTGKWLPSGGGNVVDMCSFNSKSRACLLALIDAGATLNARNSFGLSSFQRAVGLGAEEMVQILLESVEEGRQQDFVNELNPITGETALMKAESRGHTGVVSLLLAAVNNAINNDGDTELIEACTLVGKDGVVEKLLENTAHL